MIQAQRPFLVLALLMTTLAESGEQSYDARPSLELLEYLAEFVEDDRGQLIDPMEQIEQVRNEEPQTRGVVNDWINR